MQKCRYCCGSFTKKRLKAHQISCFQKKYAKVAENRTETRERVEASNTVYQSQSNSSARKRTMSTGGDRVSKRRSTQEPNVNARTTISDNNNEGSYLDDGYQNDDYDFGTDYDDPARYICAFDDGQEDPTVRTSDNENQTSAAIDLGNGAERKEVYVYGEVPRLSSSELLSLDLLKIIEDFNITRAAYEQLVKYINSAMSLRSKFGKLTYPYTCQSGSFYQLSLDVTNPCQEFITVLSPHLTQNLLTSLYPVSKLSWLT
ncbi:hypothetical protein BJV82DRAFT_601288 [Fennellomyces sp. T-0311]|nr:hypothetical protein BJV82DRAFT_601288 [Fennellomyces sp. T-0311]